MDSTDAKLVAIGVIVLLVFLATAWEKNEESIMKEVNAFLSIPWAEIGITVGVLIITVTVGWMIYNHRKKKREREENNEEFKRSQKKAIRKLTDIDYTYMSSDDIKSKVRDIKRELKSPYYQMFEDHKILLDEFYQYAKYMIKKREVYQLNIQLIFYLFHTQ